MNDLKIHLFYITPGMSRLDKWYIGTHGIIGTEYESPPKEYKQCCLRTFIVKVLNEALKIDKEFKHGIGTNDVTMTVVHYRVSVWKSVDGTWECCRVRNSMKWRTTIPYSDNSPSPLG